MYLPGMTPSAPSVRRSSKSRARGRGTRVVDKDRDMGDDGNERSDEVTVTRATR